MLKEVTRKPSQLPGAGEAAGDTTVSVEVTPTLQHSLLFSWVPPAKLPTVPPDGGTGGLI